MNITPHVNPLPVQTAVNPPTDNLRRENNLREVIAPVVATTNSAAEKAVASDRERGKSPTQNNESIDFVSLQEKAEKEASTITDGSSQDKHEQNANNSESPDTQKNAEVSDSDKDGQTSAEEKSQAQEIQNLKKRDQEVRNHELAHSSVGGSVAGSPSYSYQTGPDGKRYAVEGEVNVDLSPVPGDPQATISKMQKVYAAALAPVSPSAQDSRVAAVATQKILAAQSEISVDEPDSENTRTQPTDTENNNAVSSESDSDYDDLDYNNTDFDKKMDQTLLAQEDVTPHRDISIDKRAGRIEQFYSHINQAYEKSSRSNFNIAV